MPKRERIPTKYPGVYLVESVSPATGKPDHVVYIRYKKDGKLIEEKAGRTSVDAMTPAKAAQVRSMRMAGRSDPNTVRRAKAKAAKESEAEPWTITRIWEAYHAAHPARRCSHTDAANIKHALPAVGHKTPAELTTQDLDRLRRKLSSTKGQRTTANLAPQTILNVLSLVKRLVRWAEVNGYIAAAHHLKFTMPHVDNIKTENMTPEQARAYFQALDEELDQDHAAFFRIMLLTGIRKRALLALRWSDVDLERGFLTLQGTTAKNKRTMTVPLPPQAVEVFRSISVTGNPYVWPGRNNRPRTSFAVMGQRLRAKAGLPEDFRPCHGLRHSFASWLASSGKVDLYTLQRLLTHATPSMTQRYAHLTDAALKRAAEVTDSLFDMGELGPAEYAGGDHTEQPT